MTHAIQAVYDKGVIKPLEKLHLHDGERIKMIVLTEKASSSGRVVFQAINSIAELPLEGKKGKFSGRDHDKLLYGSVGK